MKKHLLLTAFFIALFIPPVRAENIGRDAGLIVGGVGRMVFSALQLPFDILQGTAQNFPFGAVTGAINGVFRTLSGLTQGTSEVAQGAVPYAKYAALAL